MRINIDGDGALAGGEDRRKETGVGALNKFVAANRLTRDEAAARNGALDVGNDVWRVGALHHSQPYGAARPYRPLEICLNNLCAHWQIARSGENLIGFDLRRGGKRLNNRRYSLLAAAYKKHGRAASGQRHTQDYDSRQFHRSKIQCLASK